MAPRFVLALLLSVAGIIPILLPSPVVAISVSIPLQAPSTAPTLSPSLVSLSIEQDRWNDWSGTTSPNTFFFNTFDNLRQLTGAPPGIRIGANSEDHTNFNAALKTAQDIFPAPTTTTPYPEALNITVGNAYYQAVQNLLPGTHVIWGVNFGQNNITAAFLEAKAIANAFASPAVKNAGIVLDFVEIGNEADLYKNNGLRPSSYTVQQWIKFATNVSAAAGITASSHTKLLGASFAASSHGSGFSPQSLFNGGLLQSAPGKLVTTISQHRYSGSFCSGSGALLQDLMTKSSIRSNVSTFLPDIQATHAQGLRYIFGETNSFSCHGAPGVSNTAGSALWTLDYLLSATQVGIEQVFFHDGIGFKYNLIQPLTLTRSTIDASPLPSPLPPHVQPQYYAAIIAAEATGKQVTQAAEITVSNSQVSGYGFFEGGVLKRAVFINLNAFLSGSTTRSSVHLDFTFSGSGTKPTKMTVKRLSIGHADDTSGVTWGGQTYETSDGRVSGTLNVTSSAISAGVDVHATEVVLLTFS